MTLTTKRLEDLTTGDIAQVYHGATGRCYCGCAGTYHESDRMKAKVIAMLKAAPERVTVLGGGLRMRGGGLDSSVLTIQRADGSGREYTAYTREGVKVAG